MQKLSGLASRPAQTVSPADAPRTAPPAQAGDEARARPVPVEAHVRQLLGSRPLAATRSPFALRGRASDELIVERTALALTGLANLADGNRARRRDPPLADRDYLHIAVTHAIPQAVLKAMINPLGDLEPEGAAFMRTRELPASLKW